MGVESDKLRDLVDNEYPAKITNINSSITAIEAEESNLNDTKDAIEWQMDAAGDDTLAVVLTKTDVDVTYIFGDWKVLNITDFEGHEDFTSLLTNPVITSSTAITCDGDATGYFQTGNEMLVINTSATQYRVEVVSSSYSAMPDETTITMSGDAMSGALDTINRLVYEYGGTGWDSDSDIIENEAIFQESYSHLNDEISTSGTYGIDDKLAKLSTAKSVLNSDKTKYTDAITYYDKFAT